jgi:hypothetical protein
VFVIFWVAFRQKLRVATCFTAIPSLVVSATVFNLALRDMLPAWFEFSAIYSDNLTDGIKFWYVVAGLF